MTTTSTVIWNPTTEFNFCQYFQLHDNEHISILLPLLPCSTFKELKRLLLCQPRGMAPGIVDPNIQRIPDERAPLLLAVSHRTVWLYDQYKGHSVYYDNRVNSILVDIEVFLRLGLCHLHDIIRIRMSRTLRLIFFCRTVWSVHYNYYYIKTRVYLL